MVSYVPQSSVLKASGTVRGNYRFNIPLSYELNVLHVI